MTRGFLLAGLLVSLSAAIGGCHRQPAPPPAQNDGVGALTKKGKEAENAAMAAAVEAKKRREAEKAAE